MTTQTTVFIVDDDPVVSDSLKWLMVSDGLTARPFNSPREFLSQVTHNERGCLLLDLHMPEMGGLEVIARLRELGISLPTIVITAHGDIAQAVQAMKAGALDFLEKPANGKVLLQKVRQALDQDRKRAQAELHTRDVEERLERLTPRERDVVTLLGEGFSNKEIARRLSISHRTVEVHRANIMNKMNVRRLPELVRDLARVSHPVS